MASLEEKRLAAKRLYAKSLTAKPQQPVATPEPMTDFGPAAGFDAREWQEQNSLIADPATNQSIINDIFGMLHGAQNTATAGYAPEIGAAVSAPFARNEGEGLGEAYQRLLQGNREASNEAEGKSPVGTAIGSVLGLGPAMKATGMVEQGIRDVLPGAGGLLNRIAAAAGAGGLTGAAWNPGEDMSRLGNAAIGMGVGGLAETASGLFSAAKKAFFPSKEDIGKATAQRVFGDLNDLSGGEMAPEALIAARQGLGDQAIVADLHPNLQQSVSAAIANRADPKAAGNLIKTAQSRNTDEMAMDALSQGLGTEKPRFVAAQETQQALQVLGKKHQEIVAEMDATSVIPTKEILDKLTETFGKAPIGPKGNAYNALLKSVGIKSGENANLKGDLKPSDLIDIKQQIDGMLDNLSNNFTSPPADKGTRANLVAMRRDISDRLSAISPQYAGLNKAYGGEFEFARARELGEKLVSNATKQTVDDFKQEFNDLSKSGQQAFREGAGYALFQKAQASGGGAALKAMTKNAAQRDALNTVFGEAVSDKLVEQASNIATMFQTNEMIAAMQGKAAASASEITNSTNPIGSILDVASAGAMGIGGHLLGGAAQGALRRTGMGLSNAGRAQVNTSLVNLGAKQGTGADDALRDLYHYMYQQMRPVGANPAVPLLAGANQQR